MPDEQTHNVEHEWQLFEALHAAPETTQADLAARVGVAVGTVNWYLKRWAAKGYITIKRIDRWRWRYLLTPQGMARKAVLARKYVDASMALYRRTRAEAQGLIAQVQAAGFQQVIIHGDGEIAEVCRLTCLEMGVEALPREAPPAQDPQLPALVIDGVHLSLRQPPSESSPAADAPPTRAGDAETDSSRSTT